MAIQVDNWSFNEGGASGVYTAGQEITLTYTYTSTDYTGTPTTTLKTLMCLLRL